MDELFIWFELAAAGILLAFSAFFSGSETALFAIPRLRVDGLREQKDRRGRLVAKLLARPNRLLIAILVGNLVVNVALTGILGERIRQWCMDMQWTNVSAYLFATAVMTGILLIFGEITPKVIAVQNAERMGLVVARPVAFFCALVRPAQSMLEVITRWALAVMRILKLRPDHIVTETHVLTALSIGERYGVVEREERRMIQSVLEFSDTQTEHIMIPRPDMVTLPLSATRRNALDTINITGYSRIPVCDESVDNVIGIVYGKDLLPFVAKNELDAPVRPILRQPYFVPPTKRVADLATELRRRKTHMAIVVDEYGGTAGLITLEDVLEEIVGEIDDESDGRRQMVRRIDECTIVADGRLELSELEDLLGTEVPQHEHNTLAGLLMEFLGHVPVGGEETTFGDTTLIVEEVRNRRVRFVRIVSPALNEKSEYEKDRGI